MKIAYIADIRLPTEKAHGIQIMETCAAFAAAGHEVTLYASSWKSSDEDAIFDHYHVHRSFRIKKISGVGLVWLGALGFLIRSRIFAVNAARVVRKTSYDVVYTRDASVVIRLARFNSLSSSGHAFPVYKVFYEIHDVRRGQSQRSALAGASGVIAISRGLAEYCRSVGVPDRKIIVAPDGVDLNKFNITESPEECRVKLGLPQNKKIVLYSGHLYSWKGADVLAKAALLGSFPHHAVAVFVGGTDSDIEVFKRRFDHKDPRIMIVGHKSHDLIPHYLRAADVLVLPNSAKDHVSRLYTSPLKLFEYMVAGKPIVASDLPSIREVLDDSNAVLVRPGDPRALTDGIKCVIDDITSADRIATQAREKSGQYSWKARVELIADFMSERVGKDAGSGQVANSKDMTKKVVKDSDFYNKESSRYSEKRYPTRATHYEHFFFKRRSSLVIDILKKRLNEWRYIGKNMPDDNGSGLSLLEIGCADGVVIRRISHELPSVFTSMIGIDTAEDMIRQARILTPVGADFFVRGTEPRGQKFNVVIEIGVANYADFNSELAYARDHLKEGGVYILSIAGRGSLNARLGGGEGYSNFLSYAEYEKMIREVFNIKKIIPVGLRIPLLWRLPILARIIQPALEIILAPVALGLFHEKVYLLTHP